MPDAARLRDELTRPSREDLVADLKADERTRRDRRITDATVQLHEEVGPAKTTVAEVARRAGVTRLTVYNNFPEERELFAACQGHWLELHPPPRYDPSEGAEAVLRSLYGWYRETARMAENVRRDRAAVPALGGGPLAALALDFWTWRRLMAEGLGDDEAAALMARVIDGG
jgi:AcrR family transcriptional regulator